MKKFKFSNVKFIILAMFILTNGLIVFESSLPGSISSQRSNFFTNIASFIINGITPDQEPTIIPVNQLQVFDHQDQTVEHLSTYQIPLGVTRRFKAVALPTDATDKNVTWSSSQPSSLRVTSGGYLEARELSEAVEVSVHSTSADIEMTFYVDIVEKTAPLDFTVSIDKPTLLVGESARLTIELDERASREYDPSKLVYSSTNEAVATINQYGVIHAKSVGSTEISISNHPASYIITIHENPNPIVVPTEISILGPTTGYVYSYVNLSWDFLENNVTDNTVTFTSSNPAIATVTNDGRVYGSKVSGIATIRVYANADFNVYDEIDIEFVDVLPTHLSLSASVTEVNAGTKLTISSTLTHGLPDQTLVVTNQEVVYTSSDETIATVTSINGQGIVLGLHRGVVTITAYAQADPSVTSTITIAVIPLEVINNDNITTFGGYLRKALGHFLLFFVNGVLGLLSFYLLFDKISLTTRMLVSLIPGAIFAGLSEFIQSFVPQRGATMADVGINFLGYLVAVLIVYFILVFIHRDAKKKT